MELEKVDTMINRFCVDFSTVTKNIKYSMYALNLLLRAYTEEYFNC